MINLKGIPWTPEIDRKCDDGCYRNCWHDQNPEGMDGDEEEQQEERDEEICLSLCKVLSHGHSMHSPECPRFIEPMDR